MKNITILGVTGSIGQQTVDVCLHHQDEFNVVAMSAGKNIVLLETTIQKINPQVVCVIDEKDCNYLQEKYPHIRFVFGSAGLDEIATIDQVDIVLNAIVGFAGLLPTIHAIESKKDIALALDIDEDIISKVPIILYFKDGELATTHGIFTASEFQDLLENQDIKSQ